MLFSRTSLGIEVREEAIKAVLLRKHLGRIRLLFEATFPVSPGGEWDRGLALRGAIQELASRLKSRPDDVIIGIPRRTVTMRQLDAPFVEREDLRGLLEYEAEKHLPFPPDEGYLDFQVLSRDRNLGYQVLLVAVEKRVIEGFVLPFKEAGLLPTVVTLASFAGLNAILLGQRSSEALALIELWGEEAEVSLVQGRVLRYCRSIPLKAGSSPELVVDALEGALELVEGRLELPKRIFIEQDGVLGEELHLCLLERVGVEPLKASLPQIRRDSPTPHEPSLLAATGLALQGLRELPLRVDLLPSDMKPPRRERGFAVMVGLLVLIAILGVAVLASQVAKERFLLQKLERKIEQMRPLIEEARRLGDEIARLQREARVMKRLEVESPKRLEVLKELATLLPRGTSINSLAIELDGVKLSGSAQDTTNLVPLLEASPLFQQVEFAAPLVAQGDGKQGFQLTASFEKSFRSEEAKAWSSRSVKGDQP